MTSPSLGPARSSAGSGWPVSPSITTAITDATDPDLKALFRERIIEPRRQRLRHILQRSVDAGLLNVDADIDYAVAACTSTFYALHLTGKAIPKIWAKRTAALVWRSCGGRVPAEKAK